MHIKEEKTCKFNLIGSTGKAKKESYDSVVDRLALIILSSLRTLFFYVGFISYERQRKYFFLLTRAVACFRRRYELSANPTTCTEELLERIFF